MPASPKIALAILNDNPSSTAEMKAIEFCAAQGIPLHVLLIADTQFAKYGYVDQLAPGSSKEEFVDYVQKETEAFMANAEERLGKYSVESVIHRQEGRYVKTISAWTLDNEVTQLFVGQSPKKGLMKLKQSLAEKIQQACQCDVQIISNE